MKELPEKQPTRMKPHTGVFKVSIIALSTSATLSSLIQFWHRGIVAPSRLNENEKLLMSLSSALNGALNSSAAQVAALATNQYSEQISIPLTSYCLDDAAPVGTTSVPTRLSYTIER